MSTFSCPSVSLNNIITFYLITMPRCSGDISYNARRNPRHAYCINIFDFEGMNFLVQIVQSSKLYHTWCDYADSYMFSSRDYAHLAKNLTLFQICSNYLAFVNPELVVIRIFIWPKLSMSFSLMIEVVFLWKLGEFYNDFNILVFEYFEIFLNAGSWMPLWKQLLTRALRVFFYFSRKFDFHFCHPCTHLKHWRKASTFILPEVAEFRLFSFSFAILSLLQSQWTYLHLPIFGCI